MGTGQGIGLAAATRYLEPLPAEGFYRVLQEFYCCEKQCRLFYSEMLVQLGFDDTATPILFVPEWIEASSGSRPRAPGSSGSGSP